MKIQILRLDTQDTANSICDKLAWAKAPRVLLAFPRRRPPILDQLDLTLIQRSAGRAGSQLGISTVDRSIIAAAKDIGIPIFSSIPAAQRQPWLTREASRRPTAARRGPRSNLTDLRSRSDPSRIKAMPKWLRIASFTLGLAGFLAILLLFMPSARVDLPVGEQHQSLTMKVFPGEAVPGVLPGGQIPALMVSTIIEGKLEAPATGELSVPVDAANAVVTITNQSDQPATVPEGTVFVAGGSPEVRFFTREQVVVQAGTGQTADVNVQAVQPGSAGNVAAGTIQLVEGIIGLQIQVNNAAPASGGRDRPGRTASEQDYSALYDRLLTSLAEDAKTTLLEGQDGQIVLVPGSLRVEQVIEQTRSPEVAIPSDRAALSLKIQYSGMAVQRSDLLAVAAAGLDGILPAGWQTVPGTLTAELTNAVVIMPDSWVVANLQTSRAVRQTFQLDKQGQELTGKTIREAAGILQQNLGLSEPPVIYTNPSWWQRMPWLAFRIAWGTK